MKKYISIITLLVIFFSAVCDVSDVKAGENGNATQIIGSLSYNTDSFFRGRQIAYENMTINLDYSQKGFSLGVEYIADMETSGENSGTFFSSYSYAFEEAVVSAGVNYFDINKIKTGFEGFFEVIGRKEHWGLIPSFYQSFEFGKEYRKYSALKFEKKIPYSIGIFNPYGEISAGDFHTESWQFNHIQFGANLSCSISERMFISPHLGIIIPLEGVRKATGDSSSSLFGGISLNFRF